MTLEAFVVWHEKIAPEIEDILALLSVRLSSEPETLIDDLIEAEGWNGRTGILLAQANEWLDRASYTLKPPKEAGIEFDRRIMLDDAVASVRGCRDALEALKDALKQRLSLGQSILAYQRQFIERNPEK